MLTKSYRETREMIFPQLGGHFPRRPVPEDAVLINVAGEFDVHFVAYINNEVGKGTEVVITQPQLKRWRVKLSTLAKDAGLNGAQVAVWDWPPVEEGVRLFRYPDHDDHWVSHIIDPRCLLEHTDVPHPPIVMIPNPTTILIAGLPDREAQAMMLDLAIAAMMEERPITRRPLVIDNKWKNWSVLPDSENPLGIEYKTHFGIV